MTGETGPAAFALLCLGTVAKLALAVWLVASQAQ